MVVPEVQFLSCCPTLIKPTNTQKEEEEEEEEKYLLKLKR
jgi:hypothetical protein